MQVLNGYINFVRPLLKRQCNFVLVTRNRGQHSKLGDVVSKLVFDVIDKSVHPHVIVKSLRWKVLQGAKGSEVDHEVETRFSSSRHPLKLQNQTTLALKRFPCLESTCVLTNHRCVEIHRRRGRVSEERNR